MLVQVAVALAPRRGDARGGGDAVAGCAQLPGVRAVRRRPLGRGVRRDDGVHHRLARGGRGKRALGEGGVRPLPRGGPRAAASPAARVRASAGGKGLQKSRGENAAAAEPRARARVPTASAIWRAPPSARWASAPPEARATRTAARRGGSRACECGAKKRKNGNGNRLFAHDVHVAPPRPETGDRGGVDGDRRRERGVGAPVFAIPNRKRRRRGGARGDAEGLRRGGGGGASREATAFCSCRTSTASARRSRTPPRAGVS